MLADNIYLKFQGFHPSNLTRSYLNEKLGALQDEAPYGSTLQVTLSQDDHAFKGNIKIHSCGGKFFAAASDTDLKDVTHKLIDQIRNQIALWKTTRFADSDTKHAIYFGQNYKKEGAHETFSMA